MGGGRNQQQLSRFAGSQGLGRVSQDLVLSPKAGGDTLGSYLVVGDRFRLSQWTASKKAAFQNLDVCLRDETW